MEDRRIIHGPIVAVNLGLQGFADGLAEQGVRTLQIDWRPPVDPQLSTAWRRFQDRGRGRQTEQANLEALARLQAAEPYWVGVKRVKDAVPGIKSHMILHAGPPIAWEDMIPIQRQGVIGGILHEKLAVTKEEAAGLAESGEIELASANDFFCVGAGAGIITPNMVINVSRDRKTGLEGYCIPFEGRVGLGVWGVYNTEVEANLQIIENEFAPAVDAALSHCGGINIKSIIARSMQMNDEIHTRQTAAGLILVSEIVSPLLDLGLDYELVKKCVAQFTATERWFHPLGMSGGMAAARSIKGLEYCSVVTSIAQNGVETGIKVAALGERWFKAPAPRFVGQYFSSEWGPDDATPYMGDSTVTEVVGMGAFAAAAAPAVLRLRGGGYREAIAQSEELSNITVGRNANYPIPLLDFQGPPMGIDIVKVAETGITPICHGGIISKTGGQIGAGAARYPIEHYLAATAAYLEKYTE
ncbi:MAG: DUF1116 domain-containing protein [Gracilibacteraceae bacterium]|jgi:hypothetical protein|nr:DUF1116 domain-containing protein [Gracilibacteraceae bacterium]